MERMKIKGKRRRRGGIGEGGRRRRRRRRKKTANKDGIYTSDYLMITFCLSVYESEEGKTVGLIFNA